MKLKNVCALIAVVGMFGVPALSHAQTAGATAAGAGASAGAIGGIATGTIVAGAIAAGVLAAVVSSNNNETSTPGTTGTR